MPLLEIKLENSHNAIGDKTVLFMRISQWKIQAYHHQMASTPEELETWVGPLADTGVDVVDCSLRRFWEPEFAGSDLNFAGWVNSPESLP